MTDGNIPKDSVQLERSDPLEYYVAPVWHNWIYINVPGSQVKRGQYLYDYVWPLNPRNASCNFHHLLVRSLFLYRSVITLNEILLILQ